MRPIKLFIPLVSTSLLFACGQQETTQDKSTSKNSSALSSSASASAAAAENPWQTAALAIASKHPTANFTNATFDIDAPANARKFRIKFSRIDVEKDFDFVVIQDAWGNELERLTGRHDSYVSRTIWGNKAKVVLLTDYDVRSWGFAVESVEYRGCSTSSPVTEGLRSAADCTDLRESIATLAVKEVHKRFTDGYYGGGPILFKNGAKSAAESAAAPAGGAPAHSETNTQIAGIDEPDVVKTNGNFIYALAGRQFRVFRSWPVADTALVSAIDIEGNPQSFFLDGNKAIVFSSIYSNHYFGSFPGGVAVKMMMPPGWFRSESFAKVTVLDLAGAAPVVTEEYIASGDFNGARRVGNSVRLVVNRRLVWPTLQYSPESGDPTSPDWEKAIDALEVEAVRVVESRSLTDWLPQSYRVVNGQRVPLAINCADFHVAATNGTLGLTSVLTIDLATSQVQDTSLLVDSALMYQGADNLYVTSNHDWGCYEEAGEQGEYTYVHKLDVSNPASTTYRASGVFQGQVQSQFGLDEHNGYLRVASLITRWNRPTPEEQLVSRVMVLGDVNGKLEVVGQTQDLAPGERIYSSRFVEDKGFVVTFRQVDPLFTLDLSDPQHPTVVGELTLPGFSTYLHVLDANHLFAVGNDIEEDGRTRNGVALTVFDVSDLAAPRVAHKTVVGTSNGYSEALYDHHAFSIFTPPGATDPVIAIPFSDWEPSEDGNYWGKFSSTLKLFNVNATETTFLGEIDHTGLFANNNSNEWGWWYQPNVRRGVFIDNYVSAISDAGLRAAALADLKTVVAEAAAEPQWSGTPEPERLVESAKASPAAAIPDNSIIGVKSTVALSQDIGVETVSVELDIDHPYRGDLIVILEHDGTSETLFDRSGGETKDIKRTFQTERFRNRNAKGDWTLRVIDAETKDVGTFNGWTLNVSGTTFVASGSALPYSASFGHNRFFEIPDAANDGIVSTIEIPSGVRIQSLAVSVDIEHSYRGDLTVILEHDGEEVLLHNRTGGGFNNLRRTYSVDKFNHLDARGTWKLHVVDGAANDTGHLNGWNINLTASSL